MSAMSKTRRVVRSKPSACSALLYCSRARHQTPGAASAAVDKIERRCWSKRRHGKASSSHRAHPNNQDRIGKGTRRSKQREAEAEAKAEQNGAKQDEEEIDKGRRSSSSCIQWLYCTEVVFGGTRYFLFTVVTL